MASERSGQAKRDDTPAPLRVAVVGVGKMGRHHLQAVRRLYGLAEVVAFADPSPDSRERASKLVPTALSFDSIEELLGQCDVDVVHVCTAPATHGDMARAAIEAGCDVYVEKPFMESVADARDILGKARSKGVMACAGHQLLFEAPAQQALELLPAVGGVVHLESYFSFRPVRSRIDGRAPMSPDEQLMDILPHPVYLLLRFLEAAVPDAPTEVVAVEAGPGATIHAQLRRGGLSGNLVVTLEGRPVESFLRVVGENGMLHADFVRGTVQRLLGPGSSGIDKVLNPFRISRQLVSGTVRSVGGRVLRRERSYPGLAEIFGAFYTAIREGEASPTPHESIIETLEVCERVADVLRREPVRARGKADVDPLVSGPTEGALLDLDFGSQGFEEAGIHRVLVTGGTGFLGREVVRNLLATGAVVSVLSRRPPMSWERIPEVTYFVGDLGESAPEKSLRGVDTVVHCAAETAGGWEAHERNSIGATRNLLEGAAEAGVRGIVHVSSLAVLAPPERGGVGEESPLHADSRAVGPYVWGKLESEKVALELGRKLGLEVRIVRPPALVDYRRFEAPGKLGRTIGNLSVAVGQPKEELAVADVDFVARMITWIAAHMDEAPEVVHVLPPKLPSRRELVSRLRQTNPDLRVVWLPRLALAPLSLLATGAQRVLRPGKPTIDLAKIFAVQRYENARSAALNGEVERYFASRNGVGTQRGSDSHAAESEPTMAATVGDEPE